MKHYHLITCTYCGGEDLVKNGHSENGMQRWRCKTCKKSFQLAYRYKAWKPGVKDQIVELTMNSSGVRDISRILQIDKNTVIAELKKNSKREPLSNGSRMCGTKQLESLDVILMYAAEMDEFWSFVKTKSNQRWTWYAMDKKSGIIIAWHNGKRTDKDCKILLNLMSDIPINRYYTDDWGAYERLLPSGKHIVGKDETWKIERKNLNFRTHLKRLNRKTICYSKNEAIHDNVIGLYIHRFYYKNGVYGNIPINRFNP
jgi:insertion element IS1 protein InsB